MTKPVSIQQRIRILDARGVSWRETARRLGVSRDTVRNVFRQIEVDVFGT